jgi:prenyltransferase beta subunit
MRVRLSFVLLLVPFSAGRPADHKTETIKFLAGLQQADGGFLPAPGAKGESSLRATSAAVRAIKYLGGEVPNKDKATDFVTRCYQPESGAFSDRPGGSWDVPLTAIGAMAAAELQATVRLNRSVRYLAANAKTFEEKRLAVAGMEAAKEFAPEVKDWLRESEITRNPDGTYGRGDGMGRETGGLVAMRLRSGGKLSDDHRKAVVAALKSAQREDGGFGKGGAKDSDMETTYRVLRAFHLLNEKPTDVAKLKEFLAKHRNADGGYGIAPGQPSTVGGTYYVAVIGYWLDKK